MKTKAYQIVLALLLFLASSGTSFSAMIDFEGLGLKKGDTIPTIGIASFTASAAVQGDMYAFVSSAGDDTAYFPPFSNTGNSFITNPGGYSSTTTKTIEIFFSLILCMALVFMLPILILGVTRMWSSLLQRLSTVPTIN